MLGPDIHPANNTVTVIIQPKQLSDVPPGLAQEFSPDGAGQAGAIGARRTLPIQCMAELLTSPVDR